MIYENCKYCGEPKKIPDRMQKGVSIKTFLEDPYCSREHAELGWKIEKEKQKKAEKRKAKKTPRTLSGAKRKEGSVVSSIHEG